MNTIQNPNSKMQYDGANFAWQNSRASEQRRQAARRNFAFWFLHFDFRAQRGFTLIEMLVVVGVMIVITAVVVANNVKFGGTILLQNLAYDIALSTRESQVYGMSVLRFGSEFNSPFGVHFDKSITNNKLYFIFADVNESNSYDSGEILQSTTITGGYFISGLCVTPVSGPEDCSPTVLDIIYKHPEPDAYIFANGQATQYQSARVTVSSPRNDSIGIWVEANGQISVHN